MTDRTPAAAPGSQSVQDMVGGAVQIALRDGVAELSRAEGQRGIVTLSVQLCLGDRGEPMWMKSSCYFEQNRHTKDAREHRDA